MAVGDLDEKRAKAAAKKRRARTGDATEPHELIGRDGQTYCIRLAAKEDWPDVKRLFGVADDFHSKLRPDMFQRPEGEARDDDYLQAIHDDPRQQIWVATTGAGQVMAYIHNRLYWTGSFPAAVPREVGSLQTMAVDEVYRDAGLGRYMIELAMDWAEEAGAAEHWLEVHEQNTLGRELYQRMGFVTYSQKMSMTREKRADRAREKRKKPKAKLVE